MWPWFECLTNNAIKRQFLCLHCSQSIWAEILVWSSVIKTTWFCKNRSWNNKFTKGISRKYHREVHFPSNMKINFNVDFTGELLQFSIHSFENEIYFSKISSNSCLKNSKNSSRLAIKSQYKTSFSFCRVFQQGQPTYLII